MRLIPMTSWKFWTWAKEQRLAQLRLEAKISRQRKLLRAAHACLHRGVPSHHTEARGLRDAIAQELDREA